MTDETTERIEKGSTF